MTMKKEKELPRQFIRNFYFQIFESQSIIALIVHANNERNFMVLHNFAIFIAFATMPLRKLRLANETSFRNRKINLNFSAFVIPRM